ncbi:MAG: amino acid permease [Bacteroidetes bacterium GWF2_43_63]|nr:MAG: amino acid permease [Bacteroidetes bacterium GWE2_42_42]OFY56405.1 MAG: amino acid permease [Bacteroidetes bacterium GWF2_43_63]HBG72031.1 amino acid permease [Bacteroidales bacterium]HCB63015.1 amino acid permease [Bacteroidales bacterium]HCY23234.1 amino acid permease [Bacteroidales bacterium]
MSLLMNKDLKKLTLFTAINFVIANMVGTGVFTSLGFQLFDIKNPAAILILWAIGGIMALFGSFVYGELGAAMPRSGGEYNFLSKIYHPALGFLAGWISATIGFAAPVAAACIAFGTYYHQSIDILSNTYSINWLQTTPMIAGIIILALITMVHSNSIKTGGGFQNVFTILKLTFIVIFVGAGLFFLPEAQPLSFAVSADTGNDILNPAFAVALVFVSYAYSGWNASAYFVNDLKNPVKQLPKSLVIGSVVVMVLYILLNFVFLISTPVDEMVGNPEIGLIAAMYIFGNKLGVFMGLFISLLLVSSISSMIFAGPRVTLVMGEDFKLLRFLARKNKNGIPYIALITQFAISFVLIITSTFESLIMYTGFVLNLFTFFTVLGVFVHRRKFPDAERPVKTWGYPVTPIIFLIFNLWITIFVIYSRPLESLLGLATIAVGAVLYFFSKQSNKPKTI